MKNALKVIAVIAGIIVIHLSYAVLYLVNIPCVIYRVLKQPKASRMKEFLDWNYNSAFSIDQTGSAVFYPLFNLFLKNEEGKTFGDPDETISHVSGVIRRESNYNMLGLMLSNFHNWFYRAFLNEADHLEMAANNKQ
jgi:hypothetical protein